MTDKELLELAAKAAGIVGVFVTDYNGDYYYTGNTDGIQYEREDGGWSIWNPLTDDGDALRLAVKLGMAVQQLPGRDKPCAEAWHNDKHARELWENDPYAATRRAILRAAAEIGKG